MRRPSHALGPLLALVTVVACQTAASPATTDRPGPGPTTRTTPTIQATDTPATPAMGTPPGGLPPCTGVGQLWTAPVDGATLVCVPAGDYWLGAADSDAAAPAVEKPRHHVVLHAYWIDRTEVTNDAFEACVQAGWCTPRPAERGMTGVASKTHLDYYHDPAFATYPVLINRWHDADAYCRCMGRRLPTEAEFEAAARGSDERPYPWGETLDCVHASYDGCTSDTTDVQVPAAGASPFGALNLSGNVWEWVADWYSGDAYASALEVDPAGPPTGDDHVLRGGGWSSLRADLRATSRASGAPLHYFDGQVGFRCAYDGVP